MNELKATMLQNWSPRVVAAAAEKSAINFNVATTTEKYLRGSIATSSVTNTAALLDGDEQIVWNAVC